MQLVMGMSNDGYVSNGPNDDMKWLGSDDKAAFKLLTLGANAPIAVSAKTAKSMPKNLPGRKIVELSRSGTTLQYMNTHYPYCCLIGGQTLAEEAFKLGYINIVHICTSEVNLADIGITKDAQEECIYYWLKHEDEFVKATTTKVGNCEIQTWIRSSYKDRTKQTHT
jgi:dihydrofolate reductase